MATIINPSKEDIFIEDIESGGGVSQELLRKICASINSINHDWRFPLGARMEHDLPEAAFQGLMSNAWVLEDGRDITATDYGAYLLSINYTEMIVGGNTVRLQDSRGLYTVGRNAGRSDGNQFIEELTARQLHTGQVKSHSHQFQRLNYVGGLDNVETDGANTRIAIETATTSPTGQSQNTVNSTAKYRYIKVWNEAQV